MEFDFLLFVILFSLDRPLKQLVQSRDLSLKIDERFFKEAPPPSGGGSFLEEA